LAYLIARREPSANASDESKGRYAALKDKLYQWAMDPMQRQELITAIMLCAYTIRKKGE
jgi:CRISPR-associated protein Csm1